MATKKNLIKPRRVPVTRMIQNFHLVWLDGNIDEENNEDCRNSITKLRQVVNTVNTFTDVDDCIDFIDSIKQEKAFMISSGALGETTVSIVHDKPQVNTIYIFCGNKSRHEKWAQEWPKIAGVFTDITPICQTLKKAAFDCDHNLVSISFAQKTDGSSNQNLDTLDQSFMYTQILKDILLIIDFEQIHINEFLQYTRQELSGNTEELKNVDKIAKEYRLHQPIWWYTYDCFLYSMLNKALRTMQIDQIVKMGFFVRDLHNHINKLHAEQFGGQKHLDSFTVYRGQGLSQTDFDQLKKTQGGLLSFNNFLSTSQNPDVSFQFARKTIATSNFVGILFVMKIDPSIQGTPFTAVENVGYYKSEEEEILFSMHSVFRIGQVKQFDENNRLWQVELTLTSDNDPQLHALTNQLQEETRGSTGWHRLGQLMIKLGQFDKAEELYDKLLKQTNDESEKSFLFHQLGMSKADQGKYAEAVESYEKSIRINEKILSPTDPALASSYNNIGAVYYNMGKYSKAPSYYEKALSYYEKALEISQKTLPENHLLLATSYNNIGFIYKNMGEYSKALSYYEKALEILQKTLPPNHPDLAASYNNIGGVYSKMSKYSKALSYYEKALEIRQKTLPANHPSLATSYNNIGFIYKNIGEYSKALSYYERALDIKKRLLPPDHPSIKDVKESIEIVKKNL